ncbi:MAG TPA: hypothetical protein PLO89_08620, partial [Spirochaetota bacterium]|nr:hypothetical protein [Spirochaetota bacterium]
TFGKLFEEELKNNKKIMLPSKYITHRDYSKHNDLCNEKYLFSEIEINGINEQLDSLDYRLKIFINVIEDHMNNKDIKYDENIIFNTEDSPGITGLVTTCIGSQNINIDTVGHNKHSKETALFSVATMPCTLSQINKAIEEIKTKKPGVLKSEPKIIPILY